MDDDRLNSPNTSAVTLEVLGHHLHFSQSVEDLHDGNGGTKPPKGRQELHNLMEERESSDVSELIGLDEDWRDLFMWEWNDWIAQDPNSKHLGTTVWDASMVFIKFLEKNCRRGRFCPAKLKGKRVIELGAGCGLAGFGMALLGCEVISTDQVEVLPLLMRNVERNMSRIMQANSDSASFGSIRVAELDWGNEEHIKAVNPPFDYIIGTDIVYAEHLLEPLLQTIFALSGPRTTILVCYEIRSTTVHKQMIHMWNNNFEVKTVSRSKMDGKYQHPSIQLYMMSLKAQPQYESTSNVCETVESKDSGDDNSEASGLREWDDSSEVEKIINGKLVLETGDRKLDDWEVRRYGSMAARLLRDVKIT